MNIQDGKTNREYLADGRRIHHKSMGNTMPVLLKAPYYALVLFGNVLINKIPSRHLRRWFYQLMGAKMGKDTFFARRVEVLYPKGLDLGDRVCAGWFSELDARGGIRIGDDCNISSHVKLITGGHDVDDPAYTADFLPIRIGHHVWLGTGAMILQGVTIGDGAVVSAGSVVTKDIPPFEIWGGVPAKKIRERSGLTAERDSLYKCGRIPFLF